MLVSGPITGFGSVLVNDLRLDTSTAQVLVDGQFAAETDLRVGQIIRAVATATSGGHHALSVEYEENFLGPIELLDTTAGTLTVLSQPVIIGAETRFEPPLAGSGDLAPGDAIAVSGLPLPSGEIRATFVRRAGPTEAFHITGLITALDPSTFTFEIGDQRVDYSQALLLQLSTGMPELGQIVKVRGTDLSASTFLAAEVRGRSSLPGLVTAAATSLTDFEASMAGASASSAALDMNFVGYVNAVDPPTSISIADVDVLIDSGTIVVGGTTADLDVNRKVRVEGSVVSLGQIRAARIVLL